MGFWDSVGKFLQTTRQALPPCHVCGAPGAQVCKNCHQIGCYRHSYTNFAALRSICSSCLSKSHPWASEDLRGPLPEDWPYNEAPWEILGISPDASEDEIKKAQKKISREVHPDKPGGSEERQRAVNRAAEEMLRSRVQT